MIEKRLSLKRQRVLYRKMASWRSAAMKLRSKLRSRDAKISALMMEIKAHKP